MRRICHNCFLPNRQLSNILSHMVHGIPSGDRRLRFHKSFAIHTYMFSANTYVPTQTTAEEPLIGPFNF